MNTPSFLRVISSAAAACILVSCDGTQTSTIPASGRAPARNAGSWMSPQAKKQDLLYVSDDGNYRVYVYTYPGAKLVGTLDTAYGSPAGMCVDGAGHIFVAEYNYNEVLEYAHGGQVPINTLTDSGQPLGCSIDRKTGNLAVSNAFGPSGGYGNVAIYEKAKGTPQIYYTDPSVMSGIAFCTFDDKGNLFVDGTTRYNQFAMAELPKKSKTFLYIAVNQSINTPGGIMWDGQYVALGDEAANPAMVYQLSISGSAATVAGTSTLDDTSRVRTFWISGSKKSGKTLIAPSIFGAVNFYDYPAGGSPTKTFSQNQPFAAVVSKK